MAHDYIKPRPKQSTPQITPHTVDGANPAPEKPVLCYNSRTMKYAIISDLHANLEALERVLADAHAQGAEKTLCLGDFVGYGPLPQATIDAVRAAGVVAIAGNHDDAVSGRIDTEAFIDLAGDAVSRHREALNRETLEWLRQLPHTCEGEGFVASHGDFTDPAAFNYVESEADAAANFQQLDAQLAFVGHTHVPGIFLTGASGAVYRLAAQDFALEYGKRYIVNPGSVGYPRETNGSCRSTYVLYDSDERTVVFRSLPFSVASVLQRGRAPRVRRWIVAALGLGAAALALAATLVLRPNRTVIEPAARPIATKTLELAAGRKVSANLKLAKGSAPVNLQIVFTDDGARTNGTPMTMTVKTSCTKRLQPPEGATRAEFSVFKTVSGGEARIAEFAPRQP